MRIANRNTRPIARATNLAWHKKEKAFAMVTGHDIDFVDRTPDTLPTRPVFRSTLIKMKDLVEFGNIVPRKSESETNIPTAENDIHFLSPTKFWHSWQRNVIKQSEFVKRNDIQRKIKRFLRKDHFSLQCKVHALEEELQVCVLIVFVDIVCFYVFVDIVCPLFVYVCFFLFVILIGYIEIKRTSN